MMMQGWINLSNKIKPGMEMLDFGAMDLDTYAHYADTSNGVSIMTLVPDKILFFPSPVELPDGIEWVDSADALDRLLAVTKAGRGAIALHSSRGAAGRTAGALLATYLVAT